MNLRQTMVNLVEATMKAKELHEAMDALGFPDTPYWYIYARLCDAIYDLIGEETETFDKSLTCNVLNDPELTNEDRVNILLGT